MIEFRNKSETRERKIFNNYQLWIWAALVFSIFICGSISFTHIRQKAVLEKTFSALGDIRQTRIALLNGFLHLSLSRGGNIFREEEGLALLKQSVLAFDNAIREHYFPGNGLLSETGSKKVVDDFKMKVDSFRNILDDLQKSPGNRLRIETSFRLSFTDLEHQTELLDIETQNSIKELSAKLDREFIFILWAAAFSLICICIIIFFIGRAKIKSDTDLYENRQLFESLIENSPSLIFIFSTDGRCILSNQKHAEIFRLSCESMLGSCRDLWLDKSASDEHRKNDQNILKTGIAETFEEKAILQDGYHLFLTTKFPIRNKNGEIYAVGGISTDITERKINEEHLEEAKNTAEQNDRIKTDILKKLNEAQRTAKIGSWDWKINDKTIWWSDELYSIFELDPAEFIPDEKNNAQNIHPDDYKPYQDAVFDAIKNHTELDYDLRIISGNGVLKYCKIHGIGEYDENKAPVRFYGTFYDISERKKSEELIKTALAEKETLLRELYHRTKNNMQVIRSILSLQATHSKSDEVKKVLREAGDRIQSMALVHQKLYQGHDLSRINLKDYVNDLSSLIIQSYDTLSQKVSITSNVDDIYLLIDTAIPCGLIINELLSNSFKHAFLNCSNGKISINISKKEESEITIDFSDNGSGVPEYFNFREQKTLGLQTIFAIAEDQLKGSISFSSDNGINCRIIFNDHYYKARV